MLKVRSTLHNAPCFASACITWQHEGEGRLPPPVPQLMERSSLQPPYIATNFVPCTSHDVGADVR
jgi:hypothetical protein